MATGLAAQFNAAQVQDFQNRVLMAIMNAAIQIAGEPSTHASYLKAGTVGVTAIPTSALGAAIAANAVIALSAGTPRQELVTVTAAGAAQGATSIPIVSVTLANDHWLGDPISPPTVQNHVARTNLATRVLSNPNAVMPWFIYGVALQGIDDASTDAAIESTVSSLWDDYAGRL